MQHKEPSHVKLAPCVLGLGSIVHLAPMRNQQLLGLLIALLSCECLMQAQPQPGAVLWSYNSSSTVLGCPALAADGTIYLGTASGLCAITNAGSNKWTFPAPQSYYCSPAIATDGTIYWGDSSANVRAINPDGSQKWSFPLQAGVQYQINYATSPAIGSDGTVYLVATGKLYALSPSGTKLWEFVIDSSSMPSGAHSPAIGSDGTIYVGAESRRKFYAINPNGTEKWEFKTGSDCGDSAAIAANNTIYLTGGALFALSPDGTPQWAGPLTLGASPAVGADGTIYLASTADYSLYAIAPGGQILWNAGYGPSALGFPTTVPAISGDGMIYYSASNSVFAISPQGAVQWIFSSPFTNVPPSRPTGVSPAVGPDGTIYAAFGNILYALKGGTNGLATAPWPMYRQNLRHTGKVEKPSLAPPKRRADANFDIQVAGEIGQAYSIQSTRDFLKWDFMTNFVATVLPMTVSDLTATNAPTRFYRATTP